MKKAKHKKKMPYTTFTIITGDKKRTISFRIPRVLIKLFAATVIIFIVFTALITYKAVNLSKDYQAKLENIQSLEETNKQQQAEIEKLNTITAEVRQKLKTLEKIEAKVKELVGIEE